MVERYNIFVTGLSKEEERENGPEAIFEEIQAENLSKLMKLCDPPKQDK